VDSADRGGAGAVESVRTNRTPAIHVTDSGHMTGVSAAAVLLLRQLSSHWMLLQWLSWVPAPLLD
jgi:predicted DCC family thiol-disulfide oxidoreductase YuxK